MANIEICVFGGISIFSDKMIIMKIKIMADTMEIRLPCVQRFCIYLEVKYPYWIQMVFNPRYRTSQYVVSNAVSHSGAPELKSRPEDRLSWLRVFVLFLSNARQTPGQHFNLGHDRFLPCPL
jgi:hypothetical protein